MISEEELNNFDENDIEDFNQFEEYYGFNEHMTEEDYFDNPEDYTTDI